MPQQLSPCKPFQELHELAYRTAKHTASLPSHHFLVIRPLLLTATGLCFPPQMDRDILFAVRNNFYIGAYNNAINEASDLEGLSEAEQTDKDASVYRSYIALGSHDVSDRESG